MTFLLRCSTIRMMDGFHDVLKRTRLLLAALLVFVIVGHASLPIGQPLQRQPGSAFSAATADVSLGTSQPAALTKRVEQALPPGLQTHTPVAVPSAGRIATGRPRQGWPDATGPPAFRSNFSALQARAPPAA